MYTMNVSVKITGQSLSFADDPGHFGLIAALMALHILDNMHLLYLYIVMV